MMGIIAVECLKRLCDIMMLFALIQMLAYEVALQRVIYVIIGSGFWGAA